MQVGLARGGKFNRLWESFVGGYVNVIVRGSKLLDLEFNRLVIV